MAESEEFMFTKVRQQAFEGAATNYRLELRGLLEGSADAIAEQELKLLWARSKHTIRNNGWASTALRKHRLNLGTVKVKWKDSNKKINKKMQQLWEAFAKSPNYDGYGTLANTQDNWNMAMFSGESLSRLIIKQRSDIPIPLYVQNIPKEFLDPSYNAGDPENTRNSITFAEGRPVTYHFNKNMTKVLSRTNALGNFEKVKVPADEVIHIFERQEIGQWRGIPVLASILLPLYQLDDLEDATVTKQINAQAVSWVISNTNPASALAIGSHLPSLDENDVDEATSKRRKILQTSSGGVQYLNKNEAINVVQGVGIGSEVVDLIKVELHRIAAQAGFDYTTLTGDLAGVSFSALQQVAINMKIAAEQIYNLYVINLGLVPLCNRFRELAGIYVSPKLATLEPTFQFPRRYSVNELKDTQADLLELQSNLGLYVDKLAERDLTIEDVVEDIANRPEGVSFELNSNFDKNKNVESKSNTKG